LVVLAARALTYALAPSDPLRGELAQAAGGPRLVLVTLIALLLGFGIAVAIVWLAATGVRERAALEGRRCATPRLSSLRVALRASLLALTAALAFSALESYVHLRAGLGWHSLECLIGPVHANALPVICALAAIAAAVIEALRHVLAWARRIVRLLLERPWPRGAPLGLPAAWLVVRVRSLDLPSLGRPRAPPAPAC
jgi:hypothetical protein